MRAHKIITMSRRSRQQRRRVLALTIGVCALAIPSTASAAPIENVPYSVNAIVGSSDEQSQSGGDTGYSSVNAIVGSSESQSVGSTSDSGYSSVNAITGSPAGAPTYVSSSPSTAVEGFDWISALMGAGAALALTSLAGAMLLTARRRRTVTPAPLAH